MSAPIVLAAGGTGGHVFPAHALAGELLARGRRLALITDSRGAAWAPADTGAAQGAIETHAVRAGTLALSRPLGSLKGLFDIAAGTLAARRLLARLQAGVAVGFGGYPSLPTLLAALWAGIPTVIHEQNAVLGRVNRLLAPHVSRIALSLAHTRGLERARDTETALTGNPVRAEIAAIAASLYRPPAAERTLRLLVIGGSQGARIFSRVVPPALAALDGDLRARLDVAQQCRPEDMAGVRAHYGRAAIRAELAPFFADLPARLADAHLVIARAGAATVAELATAGRPAILVPFAAAFDDHQRANARTLADRGGAWLIGEADFTASALATRLEALAADPTALASAAEQARNAATPDAARHLADLVEGLAPNRDERGRRGAAR